MTSQWISQQFSAFLKISTESFHLFRCIEKGKAVSNYKEILDFFEIKWAMLIIQNVCATEHNKNSHDGININ